MTKIHTDQRFLDRLREASSKQPHYEQRVSFVMGSLPDENDMTQEQVERVLERTALTN